MDEPRRRGRPRKDPGRLARWTPPEGWSRLVAWVSPEEKEALKRVSAEAGVPVAETEKHDGTNVRLTVRSGRLVRLEKRRNPDKRQTGASRLNGTHTRAGSSSGLP